KAAAHRYLDEAVPLTRATGDQQALMFTLRQMGNLLILDAEKAQPLIEESLEIARRIGDTRGEATALNSLGNLNEGKGDWPRANQYFREALQLARETGHRFLEATTLTNVALSEVALGDYGQAQRTTNAGYKVARELGERRLEVGLQEQEAWLAIRTGRDEEARSMLQRALALNRELGVKPLSALCLCAILEARAGNHERALECSAMLRPPAAEPSAAARVFFSSHMSEIQGALSQAQIDAALARGATMKLEDILRHYERPATEKETSPA